MLKGTTKSGFRYEIPAQNLDDYELLEVAAEVDSNMALIPKMVIMLLGERQTANLKSFLKKRDGYVSTEKIGVELHDIMSGEHELKNS
ncbi:MAG TPA: hypothetical protein DCZ00_02270 [Lactococcus sp.]|nr:hypothetical protein [Lactococcus sp.]